MQKQIQAPRKLTSMAAALGLVSGLALLPMQQASAGYLTDVGSKNVVTNAFGECWQGVWPKPDMAEKCGDKAPIGDADGDGVMDNEDKCPGSPRGQTVNAMGCPADSDGDGVINDNDQCPGTPGGTKVDSNGCKIVGDIMINLVNDEFDFDSAKLKPAMESELNDVADSIKASPGDETLDIIGHTDSVGPDAYNQGLSERRAQAVADYLAGEGIDPARMNVSGAGESQPVADNATPEGRAKNRRVEIRTR